MILLQKVVVWQLGILVISALFGVIVLAGAFEGWLSRDLKAWERIVIGIGALIAIHHDLALSLASTLFLVAAMFFFKKTAGNISEPG